MTNLEISSKYHLKRAGDTFLHLFGAYYIIVISPLLLLLRPELHTIMAPSVPLEVLIPTSLILYQKWRYYHYYYIVIIIAITAITITKNIIAIIIVLITTGIMICDYHMVIVHSELEVGILTISMSY